MTKIAEKIIIIPDLHQEVVDKVSLRAVEKYMAEGKFDRLIQLGDFMDFGVISSHNKNNLRVERNQSLYKAYNLGNQTLDRWQKAMNDKPMVILEGNHDYRVEAYIDAHPEVEGSLEVANGLNLTQRGIQWVRNWSKGEIYRRGKANFGHGNYVNEHHAKKHVMAYGECFIYGHTHDVQAFSMVTKGNNKTHMAQSMGCLCEYEQVYMKGRPSKWQQAIGEVHLLTNGFFQLFTSMIFNHTFVAPNGEIYDGRKMRCREY